MPAGGDDEEEGQVRQMTAREGAMGMGIAASMRESSMNPACRHESTHTGRWRVHQLGTDCSTSADGGTESMVNGSSAADVAAGGSAAQQRATCSEHGANLSKEKENGRECRRKHKERHACRDERSTH